MAGNIRIVRYLLMKGAQRTLQDYKGRTAIDTAIENNMTALVPLLKPTGFLERIGFKAPLAPYHEDWCSFLCFIFLYVAGNAFVLI